MGRPTIQQHQAFLKRVAAWVWVLLLCYGCAASRPPSTPPSHPKPYRVGRTWYTPMVHARDFKQRGIASWYGKKFHGRKTSSGEIYNMYAMTAAHKTLPLHTYVRVTNLTNQKRIDVRINDRGPFVRGRIIDLSYAAAKKLGVVAPGTAKVAIEALGVRRASAAGTAAESSYRSVNYYAGNFTIQVGSFTELGNAERLKKRLDQTYKNTHIAVYNNGVETFYRVRVGKCRTLDQAEAYEKIMIQHGFEDAMLVAE